MNKTRIEWTDYNRGWIEALIDGEGSLSLIKEKSLHYRRYRAKCVYTPRLNIGNYNRALLEKALRIIGAGNIYHSQKRDIFLFNIPANGLRYLLPKIELICKEKQRLLLLEALDILFSRKHSSRKQPLPKGAERLEEIYQAMKRLNKKRTKKLIS